MYSESNKIDWGLTKEVFIFLTELEVQSPELVQRLHSTIKLLSSFCFHSSLLSMLTLLSKPQESWCPSSIMESTGQEEWGRAFSSQGSVLYLGWILHPPHPSANSLFHPSSHNWAQPTVRWIPGQTGGDFCGCFWPIVIPTLRLGYGATWGQGYLANIWTDPCSVNRQEGKMALGRRWYQWNWGTERLKWLSQDSNPGSLILKPALLTK